MRGPVETHCILPKPRPHSLTLWKLGETCSKRKKFNSKIKLRKEKAYSYDPVHSKIYDTQYLL